MTWLVLCEPDDEAAVWAADGLRASGLEPVEVVTSAELEGAVWAHAVGPSKPTSTVTLADGRVLDGGRIRGTLNRLVRPPVQRVLAEALPADRAYVLHEMHALVLSWLRSLPGTTLNPPDARGFTGGWRHPVEWAALAGRAGLRARPCTAGAEGWDASSNTVVLGDRVFCSWRLERRVRDACVRLAALAGTPLLGLLLTEGPGGRQPVLAGATPLADLRQGGRPLIATLQERLS